MKIYHGSKRVIKEPLVKRSVATNDYGPSFYLTKDINAAKSWACKNNVIGVVNEYEIRSDDFNDLKILDLTDKTQFSVLNWLAILMHFRVLSPSYIRANEEALKWLEKYYVDVNEYDVVIGFRADDSYFRFPLSFVSNNIAFDDLEEIFLSGELGIQYAFNSEKAIKALKFTKAIECEDEYIGHYYKIVNEASKRFNDLLNSPKSPKKRYIFDLIREEDE